jgi:hypothetical protein
MEIEMKLKIAALVVSLSLQISVFAKAAEPEIIFGFITDMNGIYVQVSSGGCTSRSSFSVQSNKVKDRLNIVFVRSWSDPCRAFFPYSTVVHFTYEELGIDRNQKFLILNQVSPTQRANF